MSKIILKNLSVIYFIFFGMISILNPAYSMEDNFDSTQRKIARIAKLINKVDEHEFVDLNQTKVVTFEKKEAENFNKEMPGTLKSLAQIEDEKQCKNCGKQNKDCLGKNGGLSNKIKEDIKNINNLLYNVEKSLK